MSKPDWPAGSSLTCIAAQDRCHASPRFRHLCPENPGSGTRASKSHWPTWELKTLRTRTRRNR